jgi:hypothetical protein
MAHRLFVDGECAKAGGFQAALGPRSGRAGPGPPRRKRTSSRACAKRRNWRARLAAAAEARNSLTRSAAIAWVTTGCMTSSSVADHPAGHCH